SDLARSGKKRSRVANRLHVEKNAPGGGIVSKIIDQITPADIEHRSRRNDRAEPDLFLETPIQDCRQQCAALAEKRDIAGPGNVLRERRIQPHMRIHYPQAIWTDKPHDATAELFLNLKFERRAFRSSFLEARRNHHPRANARVHTLTDDARHCY